jgi:hypothetical protein
MQSGDRQLRLGTPLYSGRVVSEALLSIYCRLLIDLSYIASFDEIYDFSVDLCGHFRPTCGPF